MPTPQMNKYWIPNWEINRNVITRELQLYLGPAASVRSFTRQGQDGFLISTPGPCITDVSRVNYHHHPSPIITHPPSSKARTHSPFSAQEQIDDICEKSRQENQRQAEARLKAVVGGGGGGQASATLPTLKRPLNQPVVVSRASDSSPDDTASSSRLPRSTTRDWDQKSSSGGGGSITSTWRPDERRRDLDYEYDYDWTTTAGNRHGGSPPRRDDSRRRESRRDVYRRDERRR